MCNILEVVFSKCIRRMVRNMDVLENRMDCKFMIHGFHSGTVGVASIYRKDLIGKGPYIY